MIADKVIMRISALEASRIEQYRLLTASSPSGR